MDDASLIKLKQVSAAELVAQVRIGDPARAVLRTQPDMSATLYFQLLCRINLLIDAIKFLAIALPAREAVWWACICVRQTLPADAAAPLKAAVQAAEAWVYRPDEERRKEALGAAKAADRSSAGAAAQAAAATGGTKPPQAQPQPAAAPEAKEAPPEEDASIPARVATNVAAAVILAALQYEPQRAEERYNQFLTAGIDIANGGNGRPKKAEG
jgi:hypothetical protein